VALLAGLHMLLVAAASGTALLILVACHGIYLLYRLDGQRVGNRTGRPGPARNPSYGLVRGRPV